MQVSILARQFGRALLAAAVVLPKMMGFQSSPGSLAGRYLRHVAPIIAGTAFQSSPGSLAGRYNARLDRMDEHLLFQSSPGSLAGRYIPSIL